ncbi:hypothetical protein MNBD_GAMMA12-2123 [hydrothermal vent metagenome]|uniref:Uncharacterized protein n=1 Tax=hydrothermal vent metagenome TaxID=652676 RepID=A0A3B0XW81_9ZZZZ
MKWAKSLIFASLFLSVSAFSYNDLLWKDTRSLHNSAWQVVQLIESSKRLNHLTNSIRDFANRTGDLKQSVRSNASRTKIQRDVARMEQTFGYLMSRLQTVISTHQYKKIRSKVELMKVRYFKIHSHLVANYNIRGIYRNHPNNHNGYNYGRGYYNNGYYNGRYYNDPYYNRQYNNGRYYNGRYYNNGTYYR